MSTIEEDTIRLLKERSEKSEKESEHWRGVAHEALDSLQVTRRELVAHREKAQGNYWAWQGDGEDHIESLAYSCPVLIHRDALQIILDRRNESEKACAEMRDIAEKCLCQLQWVPDPDPSLGPCQTYREQIERFKALKGSHDA